MIGEYVGSQTNRQLFRDAQSLIPGGVNSPVRAFQAVGGDPYFVVRGEGAHVYDAEGRKYIDLVQSYGAVIAGHAHPQVTEAIQKAAALGYADRDGDRGKSRTAERILAARLVGHVVTKERYGVPHRRETETHDNRVLG